MRIQNIQRHGADVVLADNIVLELARGEKDLREWGVWGIRIDGVLYREPRDLQDEPLPLESPFVEWVNAAVASAERDGG